jgi:hypothetical protein
VTDDELARRLLALDDRPGPAAPISTARAEAMIAAALGSAPPPTAPSGKLGFIAGGGIVLGGLVAIGIAIVVSTDAAPPEDGGPPTEVLVDETARDVVLSASEPDVGERVREPVQPVDVPGGEPPADRVRLEAAPPARDRPTETVAREIATPQEQAADLLREANELRSARRWAEAERAYLEVGRSFPTTSAARIGAMSAGEIRLDHLRDPEGALVLFRRVRGGVLGAQSLFAQARAYRTLGRTSDERRALEALVRDYGGTATGEAARRRLAEVE